MTRSRYSSGTGGVKKPGVKQPKPPANKQTPPVKDDTKNFDYGLAQESTDMLADVAKQMGSSGTAFTPSASQVRSGASKGAKTIDPWRSFKTENAALTVSGINDND